MRQQKGRSPTCRCRLLSSGGYPQQGDADGFLRQNRVERVINLSLIHIWYARVTGQDEGMGIPPDGIPHIFERFYRTDQSRDRKTGGTGLGLSIAKWIVDRHGGWFEVVSRVDVGTRITFLIPLKEDKPGSASTEG